MSARLKYTLVVVHPDTGMPVALLVGEPVPEWAADMVQPDDYAEESPAGVGGAKPLTNAELEAEIAARNEGRADEDLIVPAGKTKADMIAALDADDAKSAAANTGN